jgi:inner membrane protein
MEPITHLMTGACLARSGFNRKAAYATAVMTIAAEAPDLDTLWSIDGPIASFQHHRGWTHTLIGIPFEAAILVGAFYLYHRWRTRSNSPAKPPRAPISWPLLYLFALIAFLSHILLDWTNNYGIRPFFPFNPHWYAGSFVFIFEPVLFLILLTALVAPSLFGLINAEVGANKPAFRGQNWAIFGLLATLALWSLRYIEHDKALTLAQAADYGGAPVSRVFASPAPINPFRWYTIAETPQFFQLSTTNTRDNTVATNPQSDIVYKPPTTLATLVAKRSWLGEVYLDWSQWPVVTDIGADADGLTTVTFRDLRFLSNMPLLPKQKSAPLSGAVVLNPDRRILHMDFDGRTQH